MDTQRFFDKCLEQYPDINETAIMRMPSEFQARYRLIEKLISEGNKKLQSDLDDSLESTWSSRIHALGEAYEWQCLMLGDAMFQLGAELAEKETATKMWLLK